MDALTAKRHLQNVIRWEGSVPDAEAVRIAIDALEKQIPKSPMSVKKRINAVYAKCPVCLCSTVKMPFCERCGQAIDWSEVTQ